VLIQEHRCPTQLFIDLDAAREELTNMAVTNVELLKLGLRIRAFRKGLGRNQKDFSKQCGLDRSYFGGVERGERNLSFFILCQICSGLNCDIAAVTKGIPHPEPLRSSPNTEHAMQITPKSKGMLEYLSRNSHCI
jgi:transcriptional regulator with XRE-family HTH domain